MGPEALLYTYLAGQGVKMVGDHRAKVERNQILRRAMDDADRTQTRAIDAVQTEGQQLTPQARLQAMQSAEGDIQQRAMGDLAGVAPVETSQGMGAVSSDFSAAKAQRDAQEGGRLADLVAQMSKARAPGQVTTNEAMRRSALSEKLGSLWSDQKNRAQAAELDANAVETPWWGEVGKLASTAAGAALLAGAGGPAAGAGEVSGMDLAADGIPGNAVGTSSAPWWARPRAMPRVPAWSGR